jgi:hypothetical protein
VSTRRHEANEASRSRAEHYREPWSSTELDLLLLWTGSEAELDDVSELLGRTREACRQMYYVARRSEGRLRVQEQGSRGTKVQGGSTYPPPDLRGRSRAGWSAEDQADWRADWYV